MRIAALLLLVGCNLPDDPFDLLNLDSGLPEEPPPIQRTQRPPTAISGGTLAVADTFLVVADTDRDRVLMVHLLLQKISYEINDLPEPGRVFVARDGRVHVALRGSGEVVSFWPRRPEEAVRTAVCGAPRGIAEVDDELWVACASGALYRFDPDAGRSHLINRPTTDLRDLVVFQDRIFASRFRAGEVVELDRGGRLLRTLRPQVSDGAQSAVAWRLLVTPDRRLALVHQIAHPTRTVVVAGGYGGSPTPCGTPVVSAVTVFDPDEPLVPTALENTPLAVDLAADREGRVAIAAAGFRGAAGARLLGAPVGGCQTPEAMPVAEGARFIATARLPQGFAFQSNNPPRIEVRPDEGEPWSLDLGGPISADTGHNLFHDATSAGLACASCHPEGEDDGVVWQLGAPRRTQFLAGGLDAPFHWRGELPRLQNLLADVFRVRMSGRDLEDHEVIAFERWLDGLPVPLPDPVADEEAVQRGRAAFITATCNACHIDGGADGLAHDVGTGEALQTPALRALGNRQAFMHNGCATTLADRFRPECGGEGHGDAQNLSAEERADLMIYLETL